MENFVGTTLAAVAGLEDLPRNRKRFRKRISCGNSFIHSLYNPTAPNIKQEPPAVIPVLWLG